MLPCYYYYPQFVFADLKYTYGYKVLAIDAKSTTRYIKYDAITIISKIEINRFNVLLYPLP